MVITKINYTKSCGFSMKLLNLTYKKQNIFSLETFQIRAQITFLTFQITLLRRLRFILSKQSLILRLILSAIFIIIYDYA